ncbi:MAG: type II secretion system F family protein [Gemmatimonadaceae bacterium]
MAATARQYRYRAATPQGELVAGVLAAESERAALASLEGRSLIPVELVPAGTTASRRRVVRWPGRDAGLAVWSRTMATMLAAGLTLDRALAFGVAHSPEQTARDASQHLRDAVQRGETVSSAMRGMSHLFPSVVSAMVAAGEEGGALDAAFARVAAYLEERESLRRRLRDALSYPALLAIVASLALAVLLLFVIPRFATMLEELGGTLPWTTRLLLGASAGAVRGLWFLLPAAAIMVFAARGWMKGTDRRRRWHAARLRAPLFGHIEEGIESGRFLRTFALLLESGATVPTALHVARSSVSNEDLGRRLSAALQDVQRGTSIAQAMAGTLPPLALELIAAGEESASLSDLARQAGDRLDDEAQRRLRALVAYIEPALIIGFGFLVAFVALAMLQAIYSVNSATVIGAGR